MLDEGWIKAMSDHAVARGVPGHGAPGIARYVIYGIEPGGFVTAVIENSLCEAFGRADETNRAALFEIVKYFYNEVPAPAWGSREKRLAWQRARHKNSLKEGQP